MKTGLGARVVLLTSLAASVLVGGLGFVSLIEYHRSSEPNALRFSEAFSLAMAVAGSIAAVVLLVGYLVLAELQSQSARASGANRPQAMAPQSSKDPVLRPTETDGPAPGLRIGRGDSWS